MSNAKSSPTVLTLLTEEQLRAIVSEAVHEALASVATTNQYGEAAIKQHAASAWLLTEQAAEYCGISGSALRKHVSAGHITPDSWGGRGAFRSHRFTRETLQAFLHRKAR